MTPSEGNPDTTGAFRQTGIRENLILRQEVFRAVRRFFRQAGFIEVETSLRLRAPAPERHIDHVGCGEHFLQASPELHMKRLLCAGYDRIFQICKCFRNGERSDLHLPEFTMLEWYQADADYRFLMEQTGALIRFIRRETAGNDTVFFREAEIDLAPPFYKIQLADAFRNIAGSDMEEALSEDRFEETLCFSIEPEMAKDRPVFLHGYPLAHTPLAKSVPDRPGEAQRFELYLGGIEICNGYTELTDPALQAIRFKEENAARRRSGRSEIPMPERFLTDMHAMPAASGCALGLDRLVMVLADAPSIDDVVAFVPEEE